MSLITVENLTKRFGRAVAVDGLSFEIAPGEALALWGSNGAGKTTVIRCLLGVVRCRGRISVGGLDVRGQGKRARRLVGYVPQELAFHDDTRVAQAMRFFCALRRVPPRRALELLDRVGLAGHEGKRVRDLSGGMKQRLALAVALLADPPVIVLDEPTSNLDAKSRDEVVRTLAELKREGKTILFASHRAEELDALADRVLLMERGRAVGERCPSRTPPAPAAGLRTLWLRTGIEHADRALAELRTAGFDARLNGQGVYVAVSPAAKAAPFRVLASTDIRIDDFEIIAHEEASA